jgi:CubicO group peptidase (beta-lactamase class C family)
MIFKRAFQTAAAAVVLTAGLTGQTAAAKQTDIKLPDTVPGRLMTDWLARCDAPDAEKMAKWNAEHYSERVLKIMSADKLAKIDAQFCSVDGGYRVIEVSESKPDQIDVLVVATKTDLWSHFNLLMDKDKPDKIGGFGAAPASPAESALPKDLSDAGIISDISDHADKLGKAGLFSGIVTVARGNQPILTRTEGYADRAKQTPFTHSTQFTLGSMGKLFTTAAIGQLVDQGKLSYDDVVGKFFPDFANKTVREKVTVGMLLSHTAGMKDFLGKRTPEMMKNGVKRAAEFIPLYEKDELRFEPGKDWAYSNAGLALAGAIVEKVSGEDYPDYIRKHIFLPLGMKDSDPNNIPAQHPQLVVPYTRGPGGEGSEWHEAVHDIGSPAGGAISSVADLIRFADALRSGKLVSKATFEKITQQHGKTPWGGLYGYGMQIENLYGRTVVGHGGGFPGVNTHLYIVLDSAYTVVVLSNQDPPAADLIGGRAMALATERAKKEK